MSEPTDILCEVFVAELLERMVASPALQQLNAVVDRDVLNALKKAGRATLAVHLGAELTNEEFVGYVERYTEIFVTAITRDDVPERLANRLLGPAHAVVISYKRPDLIDVFEPRTGDARDAPVRDVQDPQLCLITRRYVLRYRTARDSLYA